MKLPADAVVVLETFQKAAGWEQRARLLMQWGERLPALSDAQMCDANRVHGRESQVWLVGEGREGHWQFSANSDARLIRGLVALLLA
ncbi:SufE family protein, partial [Pseudomonas fluorescens]|uniref:SufE family protein n=1 Tax=Pseudomonas fluorescens TaxID=294 RepID=UPI003C230468